MELELTALMRLIAIALVSSLGLATPNGSFAEGAPQPEWDGDGIIEEGEDEIAELARAAQNPVADLISFPIQNNLTFDVGPQARSLNVMNIQPVWPFSPTDDWNIITRTILPVVSQPPLLPGGDRQWGLGDTVFTAFASPSKPELWPWGKILWGVGPAVSIPTATDNRRGTDSWGLGPSIVVLGMPGNFVLGVLANNIWSVGDSGQDVNFFFSQWFVNYNLHDGWYLVTAPIITAN